MEIETWAIKNAWYWYRDPENDNAELMIGELDGRLVAVAGYMRVAPLTWYLPGLLVEQFHRSKKLGKHMLTMTLAHLAATSPKEAANWLVHSNNLSMLKLSAEIGAVQSHSEMIHCGTEATPSLYIHWQFELESLV